MTIYKAILAIFFIAIFSMSCAYASTSSINYLDALKFAEQQHAIDSRINIAHEIQLVLDAASQPHSRRCGSCHPRGNPNIPGEVVIAWHHASCTEC